MKNFKSFIPDDSKYFLIEEKKHSSEKINLRYEFKKQKKTYSVGVDYRLNKDEEETDIKINVKDNVTGKIESYGMHILKEQDHYTVSLRYNEQVLKYSVPNQSYLAAREETKQDFTKAFDKSLTILPKSLMGGVLGFTYFGENFMARRDDLAGDIAYMVDVHEAIHTHDEYETRVLTSWMLSREMPKYRK